MLAPNHENLAPKTAHSGNRLAGFRNNIAAIATSILALSTAQAGPLTRDVMTSDPYIFNARGLLGTTEGTFDLNEIYMRLASNPDAPIYDTTGSLVFRDDGSLLMLLNVEENGAQIPAFSAEFDLIPADNNPGVYSLYTNGIYSGGLFGGPGYKDVEVLSHESGIRFAPYGTIPAIPEPGTLPLMGLGLGALAYGYSKRRRSENASNDEGAQAA